VRVFLCTRPTDLRKGFDGLSGFELTVTELALLLTGIDRATARRRKRYTRAG
jgi:hypothetical protein